MRVAVPFSSCAPRFASSSSSESHSIFRRMTTPNVKKHRPCAAKVNSWLLDTRKCIEDGDACAIFLGNESCDLDSVVSPIGLAYAKNFAGNRSMPVLNVRRDELRLRRDVLLELNNSGVLPSNLLCIDEIDMDTVLSKGGGLNLVDHNELTGHQSNLTPHVTSIVDHHIDSGLYLDANRFLERSGSCASLVSKCTPDDDALPPTIARLLLGALLVDTHALERRAIEADTVAATRLTKLSGLEKKEWARILQQIGRARADFEGFSARDLLLKDYKTFSGGNANAGIASVIIDLADWVNMDEENSRLTTEVLEELLIEKQVDVLVVLTAFRNQRRQVLVHGSSNVANQVRMKLPSFDAMKLENIHIQGFAPGSCFAQHNRDATRKITAPLVVGILCET